MDRRQFLGASTLGFLTATLGSCKQTNRFELHRNQVFGCFGDSITALKNGYVAMLQNNYDEHYPDLDLRFLNYGKPSETVTGLTEKVHPGPRPYLFERLDTELEKQKIDVALFCYGINCGIYGKPSPALFDSFRIGVYTFLEKMKNRQIKVVLLTPPPLVLDVMDKSTSDNDNDNEPHGYLNPYPEYDKKVLQEFKRIILNMDHPSVVSKIDIHTPLSQNTDSCYDTDPIHPNITGHRLITDTIIENLSVQRT